MTEVERKRDSKRYIERKKERKRERESKRKRERHDFVFHFTRQLIPEKMADV